MSISDILAIQVKRSNNDLIVEYLYSIFTRFISLHKRLTHNYINISDFGNITRKQDNAV